MRKISLHLARTPQEYEELNESYQELQRLYYGALEKNLDLIDKITDLHNDIHRLRGKSKRKI